MEKGGLLNRDWQPRHLEIDKRQMRWYENKKGLNGTLNFDYYKCSIKEEDIKG